MTIHDIGPCADPLDVAKVLWPHVYFYDKQREAIYSALRNDNTYVPAGNMLGKDFLAGFLCVYWCLTRWPWRVVTTSAKEDHLRVLWGEINRYLRTSTIPLTHDKGGPLILTHQSVRLLRQGARCPTSYMIGMVASADSIAAMQGHHVANTGDGVPRTLFVVDEASSVPDEYMAMASTWAHRTLTIGNPWPTSNFFFRAVKGDPRAEQPGGDVPDPDEPGRYTQKVIHIRATDSPNVRYGLAQQARGEKPDDTVLVPGVISWKTYATRRRTWDKLRQTVSLDGEFYLGAENLLFPADWLAAAEQAAVDLRAAFPGGAAGKTRKAKAMGVDPAEGGDSSAWVVGDEYGVLDLVSIKTPDTAAVYRQTLALIHKWGLDPRSVLFDRGGGGKEHADRLREAGFAVRTVGFGEAVSVEPRRGITLFAEKLDVREGRYAYANRRAEMYGDLSAIIDPGQAASRPGGRVYGIPAWFPQFRRQIGAIPRQYDSEGRLVLPPKTTPPAGAGSKTRSLVDIVGHSPDEADALVLMVHALLKPGGRATAGAV